MYGVPYQNWKKKKLINWIYHAKVRRKEKVKMKLAEEKKAPHSNNNCQGSPSSSKYEIQQMLKSMLYIIVNDTRNERNDSICYLISK